MDDAAHRHDGTPERAAEVLGHLYALAAAHISGDRGAIELILENVPLHAREAMPEAAIAIAYTSVRMFPDHDDPFADPQVSSLPSWMLEALVSVLDGIAPDFIPLRGRDPVEASIRTVGAFWLWAAHGEQQEALRIARHHCANMVLYRDEGLRRRSDDADDEGWN